MGDFFIHNMAEEKKNKQGQINIELDETVAQGEYSNLAIINHSVSEFVVDFINIMPGTPKSKVKSRIILTPKNLYQPPSRRYPKFVVTFCILSRF